MIIEHFLLPDHQSRTQEVDDDDFRTNPVILPLQYPAQAEQVIAA